MKIRDSDEFFFLLLKAHTNVPSEEVITFLSKLKTAPEYNF